MRKQEHRKVMVPGVFNAAGLIVPEPSIIPLLIPFIEDDTGCDVEYMTSNKLTSTQRPMPKVVAPMVTDAQKRPSQAVRWLTALRATWDKGDRVTERDMSHAAQPKHRTG